MKCYCNFKQDNWASLLSMTQFVYNKAKHVFTNLSSFEILMIYHSNFLYKLNVEKKNISIARDRIQNLKALQKRLIKQLTRVEKSQTKWVNQKIKLKSFKVEDEIMLSIKNFKQIKLKKKLLNKFTKLFVIENVINNKQIYRLRLFSTWKIHSIFHVSLLEKYFKNFTISISTKIELIDDKKQWEIEKILNKKKIKRSKFLVKWKNFSSFENH